MRFCASSRARRHHVNRWWRPRTPSRSVSAILNGWLHAGRRTIVAPLLSLSVSTTSRRRNMRSSSQTPRRPIFHTSMLARAWSPSSPPHHIPRRSASGTPALHPAARRSSSHIAIPKPGCLPRTSTRAACATSATVFGPPRRGTGTLARNPELKSRLQPADLARQATRQRAILSAALTRLAPGGRLLYSTCSLEPEENQSVVTAVSLPTGVTQQPLDAVLESLALSRPPSEGLLREGHLRTLPGANFAGDGFFAALFAKA